MSKLTKRILFIFILILLVSIFIFFVSRKNNTTDSIDHFKIILGDEISGRKFLISQYGYDYYIKGYDFTDSYVLIKDSDLPITDEDIKYANEKINAGSYIYTLNGIDFKIYYLRDALYNTVIDASWLKQFDYIEVETMDINIKDIKLEKSDDSQSYEFYNKDKEEKLVIKNITIQDIETNKGNLKNLEEYIQAGYSFDFFIAKLENLYHISLVKAKGILTNNEQRIIDVDDFKIAFEYEYLEGYIVYYIYLVNWIKICFSKT